MVELESGRVGEFAFLKKSKFIFKNCLLEAKGL
jgi:hypothetical protein